MLFKKKGKPSSPPSENPDLNSLIEILRGKRKAEVKHTLPHFTVGTPQIVQIPIDAKEATYQLIRPYAYASVKFDEKNGSHIYKIIEPELDSREKVIFDKLKRGLVQVMDVSMGAVKNSDALVDLLQSKISLLVEEYGIEISHESFLKVMYYVYRDFVGMNEIEPLLRDPYIEDISADGVGIPLYIVHRRFGNLKTNVIFNDLKYMQEFIVKISERCNRYVSYAEPLLDGTMPDGSRVQATLAGDVTARGPTFSIRKFPEKPFTPIDQIAMKTIDADMMAYLWYVVEHGANILIVGGTSTGKTSLLNSISFFIKPEDKIVSIEDTREINIYHENWLPAVARVGFAGTKVGEVTMYDLLKEAFRQNPKYLVVGEVRGEESAVLFQAMSSGITAMSTMHAGSIDDALKRLQTRPINLSPSLLEALDVMIVMTHMPEKGPSARRVRSLIEIISIDQESLRIKDNEMFTWDPGKDCYKKAKDSYLLKEIAALHGIDIEKINEEISRRKEFIKYLEDQKLEWRDVAKRLMKYMHSTETAQAKN